MNTNSRLKNNSLCAKLTTHSELAHKDTILTPTTIASGIVLKAGGVTAHDAIPARQYGLAAVLVPDATRSIADGARNEINSDTGLVLLREDKGTEGNDE